MIVAALGDVHLRNSKPIRRSDNYPVTLFNKLGWAFNSAYQLGVEIVVMPGDVFDSYKADLKFLRTVLQTFPGLHMKFLAVAGQHDQRYHNPDMSNTPLGILEAAGKVILLDPQSPLYVDDYDVKIGASPVNRLAFYGVSWGQSIEPVKKSSDTTNVLVIHRMISNRDYWDGHLEYDDAEKFLAQYKSFDLIISGDNHKKFTVSDKNKRRLINMGSLGRANIDQYDHQPSMTLWDSKTKEIRIMDIPIESPESVFIPEDEWKKEDLEKDIVNEEILRFVAELEQNGQDEQNPSDFSYVIKQIMDKTPEAKGAKKILLDILNEL